MLTISAPDQVRRVLDDPAFVVPPVPTDAVPVGVRWLRARVSRFANGEDHRRRRALVAELLAGVPERTLRDGARRRASALVRRRQALEVIATTVPTEALAAALEVAVAASDVGAVARAYHPHVDPGPAEDEAVARLVDACGGPDDERAAALVALFVQAHDATAGLITNAAEVMLRTRPRSDPATAIDHALLHQPPVLATRRRATAPARVGELDVPADGDLVLDLADAQRESGQLFTFGAGHRACPGQRHARAIAHGVLDALRDR